MSIAKLAVLVAAFLFLGGCAVVPVYEAAAKAKAESASDITLTTAEWATCAAPSAGSLERRYQIFTNPNGQKAIAWRRLCWGSQEVVLDAKPIQ